MTYKRTRIGKVDFKSTICLRTPRLQGEGSSVKKGEERPVLVKKGEERPVLGLVQNHKA